MSTLRERDQAAAEQAGAHHQRHRQRDLGDDERLARPAAAHAERRSLAALPQAVGQIDARDVPRRRQAEDEARRQRDREREARAPSDRRSPRRAAAGPAAPARAAPSRPSAPRSRRRCRRRSASTTLSVSSWRTSRIRPAPTAARTTISRPRAEARASSRLATLAQAISSTKATAPSSTNSVCRVSPTTASCSGTTAMPLSALLTGYCCASARGDGGHLRLRLLQRHARRRAGRHAR